MIDWKLEKLAEGVGIYISREHRFGTDAFLLADFAAPRRRDLACDLGTGCGIIPLLWFRGEGPKAAYGLEIQSQAVAQMVSSVEWSGLDGRVIPVEGDLRDLPKALPAGQFDLVSCNPPYKERGRGLLSESPAEQIARHETCCSIEDVCRAASRLLRFGGRFCLCQRPERLADVLTAMRSWGLEPKRLRFVQKREDTPPWLFLAEGKKGSKPFMKVERPLVIQGEGGFSRELLDIYGKADNLRTVQTDG